MDEASHRLHRAAVLLTTADIHFSDVIISGSLKRGFSHVSRYDLFGEFMGRMHGEGVMDHVPQVLAAYLKVLEALAVTEQGAKAMFAQLKDEGMGRLSWQRMLHAIVQCCDRYTRHRSQVINLGQACISRYLHSELRHQKDGQGNSRFLALQATMIFDLMLKVADP